MDEKICDGLLKCVIPHAIYYVHSNQQMIVYVELTQYYIWIESIMIIQLQIFPGTHSLVLVRVVLPQYEGENSSMEPKVDCQRQHEPLKCNPCDAAIGFGPNCCRIVILGLKSEDTPN